MKTYRTFAVRYTEQHRGMEQLAARCAHNPNVTGSSPVPATKITKTLSNVDLRGFFVGGTFGGTYF